MVTHQKIDERLLGMVRLCVSKIDRDPGLLAKVAASIPRIADSRIRADWQTLIQEPWPVLRARLVDPSESGNAFRQNAPLGGLLSNRERLEFFRP